MKLSNLGWVKHSVLSVQSVVSVLIMLRFVFWYLLPDASWGRIGSRLQGKTNWKTFYFFKQVLTMEALQKQVNTWNWNKKLGASQTRQRKWWMSFSCKWHQYSRVFIFSPLRPTRPSSSSHPPLSHTAVYSGDLSSTEGGISFPFPLCLFPPTLEKPQSNSCWVPDSSVLRRAHIPRQYPQYRNHLPPQPGMLISSPGFHQTLV